MPTPLKAFIRKPPEPKHHELLELKLGSMVELSDRITFRESEVTSRTFQLIERKKYESQNLLRYLYRLIDGEDEVILGVDGVEGSDDFEVTRWIIDNEEEIHEELPETIVLYHLPEEAEDEDEEIEVQYQLDEVVPADLTVTNAREQSEYTVELYEYSGDNSELMSIELCGDWLTAYVGYEISTSDVNIFPAEEDEAEYL